MEELLVLFLGLDAAATSFCAAAASFCAAAASFCAAAASFCAANLCCKSAATLFALFDCGCRWHTEEVMGSVVGTVSMLRKV